MARKKTTKPEAPAVSVKVKTESVSEFVDKGELILDYANVNGCRFHLTGQKALFTTVAFPEGVLPADFEPGKYDVTATFMFTVAVTEK